MTAGSQVPDVESLDVDDVYSGNVSECSGETLSLVVDDDQRSFLDSVLVSSDFGDSASESLSVDDSLYILEASESLEDFNDFLGLLDLVDFRVENQGKLRNFVYLVSSGGDQGVNSGGGDG